MEFLFGFIFGAVAACTVLVGFLKTIMRHELEAMKQEWRDWI